MILPGQEWRFDDGQNFMTVEVISIDVDYNSAHCKVLESDYLYQGYYHTFSMAKTSEDPGIGGVFWNVVKEVKITYGATCSKCSNLYPYAVETPDFKCWACRHGF